MPRVPADLSGEAVVRALGRLGFVCVRRRGSHAVLRRAVAAGTIVCVVPLHHELARGTLRSVLRQAQVDLDTFLGLL